MVNLGLVSTVVQKGRRRGLRHVAGSRRALAFGLCTAVVAVAFEAMAVATAMPVAARQLHGIHLYAWPFSVFLIGMLFATVAAGRLADRIGPARPMIGGMIIFGLALITAASSTHMLQLIAARLIQGLGGGVMAVATYVCIARIFDPAQRPRMLSFLSTAWVLPSLAGPALAAWLTARYGWQTVFLAVLPLLLLAGVMVVPALLYLADEPAPAEQASTREPAALWAAGLAALGAAGIQYAGQRLDLASAGFAIAGLILLGISLPNLMPRRFFTFGHGLPAVIVVRGLLAGAFFGAEAFVPLMLVEQRHLPLLLAGGVLTIGSLGWTAGSWTQSRPSLRLSRNVIITLGACCILVGLALSALTAAVPSIWVGTIALGWMIGGFGMGLAYASTALVVMTLSPLTEQGRNASSLQLGEALGAGLFVGLGGSIFARLHSTADLPLTFGVVLAAMAAVGVLGVAMSLRIGHVRNELTPRSP